MKLNRNGTIARYYSWAYDCDLPYNFCTFFWKLLFALAVAPLIWISYPFNQNRIWKRIGLSASLLILTLTIAYIASVTLLGNYFFVKLIGAVIGFGVGALLFVGLLVGGEEGFKRLASKISNSETYKEVTGVIRERKESVKDKYCPKIEWEAK